MFPKSPIAKSRGFTSQLNESARQTDMMEVQLKLAAQQTALLKLLVLLAPREARIEYSREIDQAMHLFDED